MTDFCNVHYCVVLVVEVLVPVQVIQRANGVRYGLCASVWTENSGISHRVSQALDVNCFILLISLPSFNASPAL